MTQQKKLIDEPRGRGRPKKEDALTPADRARRYRENQKAAGLTKKYVTEKNDADADPDLESENKRLHELLREMTADRDFFKSETRRLHSENNELLQRAKEAEHLNTVNLKDIIVMRHELKACQAGKSKI